MHVSKILLLFLVAFLGFWLVSNTQLLETKENFYNIIPTEVIDDEYNNSNIDPWSYYDHASHNTYERVGDNYGVDLNCNNVTSNELIAWISHQPDGHDTLNRYVLQWDPSINIHNPNDAPRILKELLRNLPNQHKFLSIIRKCYPQNIRV